MHSEIQLMICFLSLVAPTSLNSTPLKRNLSGNKETPDISKCEKQSHEKKLDYLENLPQDIKIFISRNKSLENQNNFYESDMTYANIISLFSDIIIREICERAKIYYKDLEDAKNIQFCAIKKMCDLTLFKPGDLYKYVYSGKKMTYNWIAGAIEGHSRFTGFENHEKKKKLILLSHFVPKSDDINLIWNLYKKIRPYKGKYLVIIITPNNICSIDKKNRCCIGIKIPKPDITTQLLSNLIQPLGDAEFEQDKHFKDVEKHFYNINFEDNPFDYKLNLNTPACNFSLQLKSSRNYLKLTVKNNCLNKTHYFKFFFVLGKLYKINFNGKLLPLRNGIIEKLFYALMIYNMMPGSEFDFRNV